MDQSPGSSEKQLKHSQHVRLLQEQDEVWISSEDLRTDGSSDEEAHKKSTKKRRQKKRNKHKTTENSIALATPIQATSKLVSQPGSSRNLEQEALNLEHQWRPKRGSLKLPTLPPEGTSLEV